MDKYTVHLSLWHEFEEDGTFMGEDLDWESRDFADLEAARRCFKNWRSQADGFFETIPEVDGSNPPASLCKGEK